MRECLVHYIFLKSKMRNKVDKHMDICLRLYVTKYDITNFPYERALDLWRSDCDRKGENNTTNFSNELDMEHNSLEDHNDINLEKVMFRMNKMSTNMRTGKLIYHKI
jgi:hypothetical protein